ncbi:MAG: hypothetical protein KZQ93_08770 [Candidatus Thiodiazotropha sp. (ex Monitilora ramsayi)]|nr:hypothetical protein [Candidatus Thiodiazotropha sp. (ex Monitilora ramsayi)]
MPIVSQANHKSHQVIDTGSACNILVWIPYWDQSSAFQSYIDNKEIINYVAFFWYTLDERGEIKKYSMADEDINLVRQAKKNGAKVLAIITNLPDDEVEDALDWDPKRLESILFNEKKRHSHIRQLVKLVKDSEFDGLDIDYENLPRSYKDKFTLFVRELSDALHEEELILAVAIHPKTSDRNPRENNGSWAQDWQELAKYADQLHMMTYGEHYPSSRPGPIASPQWVERVLKYAQRNKGIPNQKIFVGIPFYAEIWMHRKWGGYSGLNINLTYSDIMRLKSKYDGVEGWDKTHTSPFLKFTDNEKKSYTAWFENRESLKEKIDLIAGLGICNYAIWRVGGESKDFWPLFK